MRRGRGRPQGQAAVLHVPAYDVGEVAHSRVPFARGFGALTVDQSRTVNVTTLPDYAGTRVYCRYTNTAHTAVPVAGTYVREADGEHASLTDGADYPVSAECRICRGHIRLGMLVQMDWEHAPAQVPA